MADILIVDDDPDVRSTLRHALEQAGHNARDAANGWLGLQLLAALRFDLAVIDIIMAKPDGLDVVRIARSRGDEVPILIVTGAIDIDGEDLVAAAIHLGANRALIKPFRPSEFISTIAEMLAAARYRRM